MRETSPLNEIKDKGVLQNERYLEHERLPFCMYRGEEVWIRLILKFKKLDKYGKEMMFMTRTEKTQLNEIKDKDVLQKMIWRSVLFYLK